MHVTQLIEAFAQNAWTTEGNVHTCPTGFNASLYVALTGSTLIVDRVATVELAEELAHVTTTRKEKYALLLSAIAVVRLAADGR